MSETNSRFLQLHDNDNVAVALDTLPIGTVLTFAQNEKIQLRQNIPRGHKFAVRSIEVEQPVIKYGFPIGLASNPIGVGDHVHEHNLRTALDDASWSEWTRPTFPEHQTPTNETFLGFRRLDGRVAVRNEVWIINTVACVNQTASRLAERANRELLPELKNVDGFHAFPHPFGCSQLGDDLSMTQGVLAGLVNHPHAGAVLLLGLGCENNRMAEQLARVHPDKLARIVSFNTQQVGDELEEGFTALSRLGQTANTPRETLPACDLIIGMKCGGSDGFSGITANPLLGRVADLHCAAGGTVLLTEVPEMFGAEPMLLRRCESARVHRDTISMIDEFKNYFRAHHQPISENPSPGNRDGGITTLEEKSLGCVQKAGTDALIRQIVPYGSTAATGLGGIALINGPGNDGVSITALATAGANLILFSTGRGTPMGAPVPTIKVATNSELATAKPAWIDFDAGRLLASETSLDDMAQDLYRQVLETASGSRLAKNEINGYREIAIWKTGVTL